MKKGIFYFVAAIVIGVLLMHFFGSEGEKEFKATQKAVKAVKSWRMRSEVSANGRLLMDRTHEANCPDQEHIIELSGYEVSEYTRMGDDFYWRKGQTWSEGKPPDTLFAPIPTPRPCMTNPAAYAADINGIDELQQYLQQIIDQGDFTKGELQTIGNLQCRDWTVKAMNPHRQLVATIFCVNEKDHLPLRISMMGDAITMDFTWNVPVKVEKPDLTPPPPPAPAESTYTTPAETPSPSY